jgi:hypothetical protein
MCLATRNANGALEVFLINNPDFRTLFLRQAQ